MDIGQKIKALREEKGMTLEELGDKVGVGKSTVRKWETGMIANMRRDKIAKVAEALDTDPSFLMGWEKENATANNLMKTYNNMVDMPDAQIRRILAYCKAMTQSDLDMIESMAKRCAETKDDN